ncbi:MAG: beta-ketoacyl synthase N-terminal-like domain-containing protein, partial [Kangiellaceae bacterium]|nr:beta-ketoacyl synthase N-terminal-like domain-containing protein [Kangiellaceae bacterium]
MAIVRVEMFNRVAITGLGAITPAGNTISENWQNIVAGKSGIDFIKKFDTENFPIKVAGEVDVDVKDFIEGKDVKHFDPFIQYALIATQEAILDAGVQNFKDVGVIIGSGQGGISN